MDIITLKNFEIVACHGVNAEEKINPQRFLVTVNVYCDVEESSVCDDVSKTVSYSDIKKAIKEFFESNCFDLIETLAVRSAYLLLKKFDRAKEVEVSIKKPDAPMSGVFDYAGVSVRRKWHRVYLALGSSMGDKDSYLNMAVECLKADENIKNVKESSRILTEPYGSVAENEFLNSAVEIDTLYSPKELLKLTQSIEQKGGRVRNKHWEDRTLDVDIIFYDDLVIEYNDLCIPHIDMQYRAFVLRPLYELCPYKIHPLLNKRVEDMLRDLPMPIKD